MSKYGKKALDWFEAVINKLGGEAGADAFLRNETEVVAPNRKWTELLDVIDLGTVVSDGTTGPEWVERLERKGYVLTQWAKGLLNSPDFVPTSGKVTHCVAIRGSFFPDNDRTTANIRAEAEHRKMTGIDMEAACLLRERFSDEDLKSMGLYWLVLMHKPVKDSAGDLDLLAVSRNGGGRKLNACYDSPGAWWLGVAGFVFAVPASRA